MPQRQVVTAGLFTTRLPVPILSPVNEVGNMEVTQDKKVPGSQSLGPVDVTSQCCKSSSRPGTMLPADIIQVLNASLLDVATDSRTRLLRRCDYAYCEMSARTKENENRKLIPAED